MKAIIKTWDRPFIECEIDEKVLNLGLQKGDRIAHLVSDKDNTIVDYIIAFKELRLYENTVIFHCSRDNIST
jgi:UDP-galactopyranose mutase